MEQFIETSKQVFESSLAEAQSIASTFKFHAPKDLTAPGIMIQHRPEVVSYSIFFCVLIHALMCKRLSRLLAAMAATCTLFVLTPQMLPNIAGIQFGSGDSFVMYGKFPVEVFILASLATFIADSVARDTNKAPFIMSSIVAGLMSTAMYVQVCLFFGVDGFFREFANGQSFEIVTQALLMLFYFQAIFTAAMHFVDIVYHTKRFGFIRLVLYIAAAISSVFGLVKIYKYAAVDALFNALAFAVRPLPIKELLPVAALIAVVILIYTGFIAGSAKKASPVGVLLYLPMCVSMLVLAMGEIKKSGLVEKELNTIHDYARSIKGVVLMPCAFVFGLMLASLPLFNADDQEAQPNKKQNQRPNKPLPKPKASSKSPSKATK